MNLTSFYVTVLSLLFMMCVGFLARKAGIITDGASKGLSTIVIKIGQPFMIIGAMLGVEFSEENIKYGFSVILMSFIAHTVFAIVAHFTVFKNKNIDEKKILEYSLVFANCGFIGFPLIQSFLGEEGLFLASFYLVSFNIFTWTWGMMILGRGRDDIKVSPKSMLLNYGTVPSVIGLILYLSRASELIERVELLSSITQGISYLGGLCTPISMVITGALIATVTPKELFLNPKIYVNCVVKLIIIPAIITVLAYLLGLSPFFIVFLAILSAMPTGSSVVMFAEMYEISKKNAAVVAGLSAILSMLTLPILGAVLNELFYVSGVQSIFRF